MLRFADVDLKALVLPLPKLHKMNICQHFILRNIYSFLAIRQCCARNPTPFTSTNENYYFPLARASRALTRPSRRVKADQKTMAIAEEREVEAAIRDRGRSRRVTSVPSLSLWPHVTRGTIDSAKSNRTAEVRQSILLICKQASLVKKNICIYKCLNYLDQV